MPIASHSGISLNRVRHIILLENDFHSPSSFQLSQSDRARLVPPGWCHYITVITHADHVSMASTSIYFDAATTYCQSHCFDLLHVLLCSAAFQALCCQ